MTGQLVIWGCHNVHGRVRPSRLEGKLLEARTEHWCNERQLLLSARLRPLTSRQLPLGPLQISANTKALSLQCARQGQEADQ
jgi:hypothetical protein